jgi:dethiobiotin synthetase
MGRQEAYFVTGTDTGVGKTHATCALLYAARRCGLVALGMKPIAAGVDARGCNDDVSRLMAASSIVAAKELVNPYCFRAPVAPHLAATEEGTAIGFDRLAGALKELRSMANLVLVEGVGGFRVPLGPTMDSADLARLFNLPVILVVGMRLGCLNHALLTFEAIRGRGLPLAGWIANCIDPAMARWQDNVAALAERLDGPLLGVLPYQRLPDPAAPGAVLTLPGTRN